MTTNLPLDQFDERMLREQEVRRKMAKAVEETRRRVRQWKDEPAEPDGDVLDFLREERLAERQMAGGGE